MFCRVIPYEGTAPYIFLSYCHKDAARVYPIIEQLARGGHRIWYDEGNHPGDDWLENIARHLDGCTVCLAMLTENAAASHNCRSELSFAVECKKTILAVVMEEFAMPLGMRMQLSAIQHLKHRDDLSGQEMLEKLYEARDLAQCRAESAAGLLREYTVMQGGTGAGGGHVTDEARVSSFVAGERLLVNQGNNGETETAEDGEEPKTGGTTGKKKFIITKRERRKLKKSAANTETETPEVEKSAEEEEQETPVIPEDEKPVEEVKQETPVIPEDEKPVEEVEQEIPATPEEEKPVEEEEQETPVVPEDEKPVEEVGQEIPATPEEEKPAEEENSVYAILFHPASGSCYYLKSATVRIGRTAFHSDIAVKDGRFLDEHHADLIWENGQCFVQDAGSFRGTFVNHRRLPAQERVALEENDIFFLHTEAFQIVCGNAAKELMAVRNVISLTNRRNAETRVLPGLRNSLGREVKIAEGFFRDTRISRNHADIYWRDGTPFVCDIGSTNGTVLNNERLERDREYVLRNGDLLRLGDTVLVVHITTLRGEEK